MSENNLEGRKVALFVSGSIAAYKSLEIVRGLLKCGAQVRVAMSEGARRFVSSLSFQSLSQGPVLVDLFCEESEVEFGHIELADWADVALVAPCSANFMARLAHGLADEICSASLLAFRGSIFVAPAMNVNMWTNAATKENAKVLKARGVRFFGPANGELACGWYGEGRMLEPGDIVSQLSLALGRRDLQNKKVVIAAGPTREWLDPVRYISNASSGKMGYALAQQARERGAEVLLISGPVELEPPHGVELRSVETGYELREALEEATIAEACNEQVDQWIFMASAVSDLLSNTPSDKKLKFKRGESLQLELDTQEDIICGLTKKIRESSFVSGSKIVCFSLETGTEEELLESARSKMFGKGADFVVANRVSESLSRDDAKVYLLSAGGETATSGLSPKLEIANQILNFVGDNAI